jgi:CRP/FNR family transcriptional regulator, cyclic AMP receptor protein
VPFSSVPRLTELLSESDQELVRSHAARRTYRNGQVIHEAGDPGDSIGVVVSGQIKLINSSRDGSEVFSGLIHTGQNFGDAGLLHGEARRHRAVAIGETVVDHIGDKAFETLLGNPAISRAFYVIAAFRLSVCLGLLDDMRTLSPEVRLARLLLRMHGAAGGTERLEFLQEDFAGMLGVSTVTLGKALRMLAREGLVASGYRHVRITDADRLAAWARAHEDD